MGKILVTGLCTLHKGRLQYGNVGNYYIVEPLFRLLHFYFPKYEILSTLQMDDRFAVKENVHILDMGMYYSWEEDDVEKARRDYVQALELSIGKSIENKSDFISIVESCEYIIDVSGDMWGDNAEHVGHNRFMVECYKLRAAQLLNKKTILYAVTPGPFEYVESSEFAKETFANYSMVLIREKNSFENLKKWGFGLNNVEYAPCPSFLFEANDSYESKWLHLISEEKNKNRKVIGMTFGGFNMPMGPYDMWPRDDWQYQTFLNVARHILEDKNNYIVLFSHTNGFIRDGEEYNLINGRDYMILNRFYEMLINDRNIEDRMLLIEEPLLPCDLKKVIGSVNLLVTGRVHASVAALSQCIPTVFLEYDRRVIYSDKMMGFSSQANMQRFVCEPSDEESIKKAFDECICNLDSVKTELEEIIPVIKNEAEMIFERIKEL